jgi:hypothetical protein
MYPEYQGQRPKMDKQQLVEKTTEALRPLESANLIATMQHLSIAQIFAHPVILIALIAIFFFGVIKRSKAVLLTLFSLICLAVIVRFAMPSQGEDLSSMSSLLPFIGGGLVVGGVIIYFSLVKTD